MENSNSKHFVLVHGSCHGAWCWFKLVNLIKVAGHRATAIDLGASGINPKQLISQVSSFSDYIQPLLNFMSSIPQNDKVILVGHSYAGLCISLAMESFPEKFESAVFLTAYMPHYNSPPGLLIHEFFKRTPVESLLDCQVTTIEDKPVSVIFGPDYMKSKLYPHSPPEDLELAKMLIRPSGLFVEDLSKECLLTEAKYGSGKRIFIVCEEDEVMKIEFQRWMIKNYPTEEVVSIKGADHMVMLSKPQELCQILLKVAE
ncbi:hypothetical protein UlMin_039370 [Ulmus minor]